MVMPLKAILTGLLILLLSGAYAQGLTCGESDPFCTGTIYDFPAGTTGTAEAGPYYGCLATYPAPAWYHMKIGNPGSITIYMYSTPLKDIDFACWGPFTDPVSPCTSGLTAGTMVDCSYSPDPQEWCDIPNGQTGEYYILLITNYSQQPCNITFSQTAGNGSTDCSILPPLVSSDSPLCVGDTLHLQAETISNATYSWSGPGGFTSPVQNPVIPGVTLAHAGDYSCIITIFSQSSPPAITPVIINDLPDASLVDNDTTVCPGAEAFMLIELTGAGPFEVICYDGSNYQTITGLTGPTDTIFVNPPGPAIYSLEQVSDTNCTKILSGETFQVLNFPPVTGIMTGGETICPGDTADLVFNLTGSPPWTITYLANGMNPQTITAGYSPYTHQVTPLTTTQYQFSQLTDINCTGSTSGQVVVTVDYPTGMLSGDNTICAGGGSELVFTMTGFPPWTIKYTINGTNEQTLTAGYSPYVVAVSPMESTLYEMTMLNDVFCDGSAGGQALIEVQQPTGVMAGDAVICNGESATLDFTLTGNPPWTLTYTENGTNPQTVTAYTTPFYLSVNPVLTTMYVFTAFADNFCQGLASGQAIITVNLQPLASAGGDKTIPNGTSTILDGEVTGGSGNYIYQWEPAGKLVDAGVLQPVTTNLFSSTLFTLTVTDEAGGCYDMDEMLVTVAGGVLSCSALAFPDMICSGETSQLQAIASGGSGSYTYQWSSDPPGFSSDLQNPVALASQSTTYYVLVNDGYNISNASVFLGVNQLPWADAGPDQGIPFGTTTVLNGSGSGGSGQYAYHWEPANKLIDHEISDPVTVNLYETTLFTLTVTDMRTGCTGGPADEMAVLISGTALGVNPQAQPAVICQGDSTRLYSLAGGGTGNFNYSWTSNPPGFTSVLPDPIVNPDESTVYTVLVNDGFNSASGSAGVTVNAKPVVDLGNDTTVCVFDTVTIDAGNPGSSYFWSNGSTNRTISLGSTGIGFDNKLVSVIVTSPQGCETTAWKIISFDFVACSGIESQDIFPGIKVFPNPGDGLLTIDIPGDYKTAVISVTDYSGRRVFGEQIVSSIITGSIYQLDIRTHPDGIYLLRIIPDNHEPVSIKYLLKK